VAPSTENSRPRRGRRRLALLAVPLLAVASCGRDAPEPKPPSFAYDERGHLLRPASPSDGRPNLVLIVVDTLRADALAAPGATDAAMPWLQGLAARGTFFANATSSAPWTPPAMASLVTGLTPTRHGCQGDIGLGTLTESSTTLAEILKNGYGYETAAFVGGPWTNARTSVFRGFDRVVPEFMLQGTKAMVGSWALRRKSTQPFFLMLHTYEAHNPYGAKNHPFPPPPPGAVRKGPDPIAALGPTPAARDLARMFLLDLASRDSLVRAHTELYRKDLGRYLWRGLKDEPDPELVSTLHAAYREGARWVDDLLRDAVAQLEEWRLLENTLLVITSDHGEAFGEHGLLMHGRQVYDELLRIPLVITGLEPFDQGRRVDGSVGIVDVLPTFLEAARLEPLAGVDGRSLVPIVRDGGGGHPVQSEEWISPERTAGDADAYAVSARSERWKYIVTFDMVNGTVREEAYDLVADPGERKDLGGNTGRVGVAPFDERFCDAVERARDLVWAVVEGRRWLQSKGYSASAGAITEERPARACAGAERR
jgi:arylsulfatase A-like enzyme